MSIVSAVHVTQNLSEEDFPGVARGWRQLGILLNLLTDPDGVKLSDWDASRTQTRLHGSAGWKAWSGMRPRLRDPLARHGCWIAELPLGPRGGHRWTVVTDDRMGSEAAKKFAAMAPRWKGSWEALAEEVLAA